LVACLQFTSGGLRGLSSTHYRSCRKINQATQDEGWKRTPTTRRDRFRPGYQERDLTSDHDNPLTQ
jgi:hypothetical protein